MRISLIQSDIVWANKAENLRLFEQKISTLAGKSDLAVLPEMFTTGFCTNALHLAETTHDETVQKIQYWTSTYQLSIAGSFMVKENDQYFNRGFLALPDGTIHFYDKRHLFRMGNEHRFFTPGNTRLILPYLGWNICLQICYDLRFPVWNRNLNNEYDLLIIAANWPTVRIHDWEVLLAARAIENQAYVCGVNRIGRDGEGITYSGQSLLLDARGNIIQQIEADKDAIYTTQINLQEVKKVRENFPVWKDADNYRIQ